MNIQFVSSNSFDRVKGVARRTNESRRRDHRDVSSGFLRSAALQMGRVVILTPSAKMGQSPGGSTTVS